MARDIYATINVDKRTKPYTYRLQIIKVLKDGKRKTTLHKSFQGANAKSLAKQEKIRLENELLAGTAGVSEKSWTIDAYTTYFIDTEKKNWKSEIHKKERIRIIEDVKQFCGNNNLLYLQDIKQFHLEKYISLLPKEWKTRTVNLRISLLKQLFSKAVDLELIFKDPARKLKKAKEKDKVSTKPMTDVQVRSFLNYLTTNETWYNPIFKTLIYTGMRRNEICELKWNWINFNENYIELPAEATKGKYKRIVPLHVEIKKILLSFARQDEFVFHNKRGESLKSNLMSRTFAKVRDALGYKDVSLHSTRATFITKSLKSGDTIAVQAIVGHQNLSTTQGYTEAFEDAKRKVIDGINY